MRLDFVDIFHPNLFTQIIQICKNMYRLSNMKFFQTNYEHAIFQHQHLSVSSTLNNRFFCTLNPQLCAHLEVIYSNHLNTKHLKSNSWLSDNFFPVFKWSDHVIRKTIQKNHRLLIIKQTFWSSFQTTIRKPDHWQPNTFWIIWIPDLSGIQMVTVHYISCTVSNWKLC